MLSDDQNDKFFVNCGLRVLTALRRIIRDVDIHSHKLKSRFNITAPQLMCLYRLAEGGEMTLSALAAGVTLSLSTVNGIVDRLEMRGLLTRRRSELDRRKVMLSVTEAGRELTHASPSLLQDRLAEALRNLPELEQATIALSLERIVELMETDCHHEFSPLVHHTAAENGRGEASPCT